MFPPRMRLLDISPNILVKVLSHGLLDYMNMTKFNELIILIEKYSNLAGMSNNRVRRTPFTVCHYTN